MNLAKWMDDHFYFVEEGGRTSAKWMYLFGWDLDHLIKAERDIRFRAERLMVAIRIAFDIRYYKCMAYSLVGAVYCKWLERRGRWWDLRRR